MEASAHRHAYTQRINRVTNHIDAHLDAPLDLPTLAALAHFSPWHFHRVFQAVTGETLAERVRRRRLEAAAQRLLATPAQSALSVALDTGFGSAEVFTRAFGAHFGMTPTAWRRGGWRAWAGARRTELGRIHHEVRKQNQAAALLFLDDPDHWPTRQLSPVEDTAMNVELRTLPPARLAYMRHTGPYGTPGIPETWQRFGAWCGAHGLMMPRHTMYGISQDNPGITPPDKCRYDCCIEAPAGFQPEGEVGVQDFAGGRYACARFTGTGATIHEAWMRMFGEWLPGSGWQADDKAGLELYEPDFAVDPKTGAFSCLLCVPVRPL